MVRWIRQKSEQEQTVDLIYQKFLNEYPFYFKGDKTMFIMPMVTNSSQMELCAEALVNALKEVHGNDWCTEERYYEGEVKLTASVLGFLSEWWTEDGVYGLADVAYVLSRLHASDDRKLSWYHIKMDEVLHGLKLADPFDQSFDVEGYADEHLAYLNRYVYDIRTKWSSDLVRNSDKLRAGEIHNGRYGLAKTPDPTLRLFYDYQALEQNDKLCIATALKTLAEPLSQIEGLDKMGYWTRGEERTARLCSEAWSEQGCDVPEGHVPNTLEIMLHQALVDCTAAARGDSSLIDQYKFLLNVQKKRMEADRELY